MTDLKHLIEDMSKKKEEANREIPDDYRTAGMHIANKRRAEEDIKEMKGAFTDELIRSSLFILPEGTDEEQSAFAEQAEKLGCFTYDADDFVESLVKDISPAIYKDQPLNQMVLGQVSYELEILAGSTGISSFNQLVLKDQQPSIEGKDDLKKSITRLFQDQVGSEFMGIVAINQLTEQAISKEFSGKVFPVVLTKTSKFNNSTLKDLTKMSSSLYNFKLDGKLTDTYVKGILKDARKSTGK